MVSKPGGFKTKIHNSRFFSLISLFARENEGHFGVLSLAHVSGKTSEKSQTRSKSSSRREMQQKKTDVAIWVFEFFLRPHSEMERDRLQI
jgi:hypothetical protein